MIDWPEHLLESILDLLENGTGLADACSQLAEKYELKSAQVAGYYHRRKPPDSPTKRRMALSPMQSSLVSQALSGMAMANLPLSSAQARKLVFEVHGVRLARSTFHDWLKRHNHELRLAKPKPLSKKRTTEVKIEEIKRFTAMIAPLLSPQNAEHCLVANFDESSVDFDQASQYVINKVGLRQTNLLCTKSSEVCSILSVVQSTGEVLFTLVILRTRTNEEDGFFALDGHGGLPPIPEDCPNMYGYRTTTGKLSQEHFHPIMLKFAADFRLTHPDHVLYLFADQAPCHTNSYTRERLFQNGIHLCFFPSNVSHFLQPLDSVPFANFKSAFRRRFQELMFTDLYNDESTRFRVVLAVLRAERDSMTPQAIRKGFELTGMWPFDAELILRNALNTGPEDDLVDELGRLNAFRVKEAVSAVLGAAEDAVARPKSKIELYGLYTAEAHHKHIEAASSDLSTPVKKSKPVKHYTLEEASAKIYAICAAEDCNRKNKSAVLGWTICDLCNCRFCPLHRKIGKAHVASESCLMEE